MDSSFEQYEKKQSELQNQVKELCAEKKLLESKICILNECLSLDKVKKKIFDLENKQKILTTLESMVCKLKFDLEPLDYLKQLLQRQLMVSSLSTNDFDIEEQKYSESSQMTVNSGCAIETLDSSSDVASEDSIMILSDYDMVSDEEVSICTEKSSTNKVDYNEALLMASSVHSISIESSNVKSVKPLLKIKSDYEDTTKEMNTSCISEQFLKMYDIVNKQDIPNCNEKDNIEPKCSLEKIELPAPKKHYLHKQVEILSEYESLSDIAIKHDNVIALIDSWVNVNINKLHEMSIENKKNVGEQQVITKDNPSPKIKNKVRTCLPNDQLRSHQFVSKHIDQIENFENVCDNIEYNDKSQLIDPVFSTNNPEYKLLIKSSLLNTESSDVIKASDKLEINNDVLEETNLDNVKNNKLCNQNEMKEFDKIISLVNISSNEDFNNKNKMKLLNSGNSNILIKSNNLSHITINTESSDNDSKKFTQLNNINELNTVNLKVDLLKGIHQYGYQDLKMLQLKYLSYFIDGFDIIFHSNPCIGKSTACFISVLQKINTSLYECQAIILVPTLELALFTQKMILSLGTFLNVSTCIGGINVPRKVSPVPHVVVSTLRGLCDMIDCKSLCKDFIKTLVIDEADKMFEQNGFFNNIRHVLLFLNNSPQLIIVSTSKLEEIKDQFSDEMKNPLYLILPHEKPSLSDGSQYFINISEEWKFDIICELYEVLHLMHAVIFCDTWNTALKIAENMCLKTYTASAIRNEMDTSQRQLILQQFQSGVSRVLVTSGLTRGENFPDVAWVINYDLPKNANDYVCKIIGCFRHNVKVINLITSDDIKIKDNIETALNINMLYLPQNIANLCA